MPGAAGCVPQAAGAAQFFSLPTAQRCFSWIACATDYEIEYGKTTICFSPDKHLIESQPLINFSRHLHTVVDLELITRHFLLYAISVSRTNCKPEGMLVVLGCIIKTIPIKQSPLWNGPLPHQKRESSCARGDYLRRIRNFVLILGPWRFESPKHGGGAWQWTNWPEMRFPSQLQIASPAFEFNRTGLGPICFPRSEGQTPW